MVVGGPVPVVHPMVYVVPAGRSGVNTTTNSDGCRVPSRSEEHTSELQSRLHLVCRLLLEQKKRSVTQGKDSDSLTRSSILLQSSSVEIFAHGDLVDACGYPVSTHLPELLRH